MFCSLFLEHITVLERRQFLSVVRVYLLSKDGKIKNFKKQPTAWEVLVSATTRLKVEVLQIELLEY